MMKQALQSLAGVEVFPIISLIIFFVIFTVVCIWAFSLDKDVITEMERIPLDNETNNGDSIDV